ncbi:MAG: TlpA disulfide reductase family protein [Verrucomicrobiota bacterium]
MKTILTTLVLACSTLVLPAANPPTIGQALPKLTELLPGAKLPATAGKVVLVDFWASWCAPCEASFPCMTRLHDKYAAKGLVIIGIGVDEEAANYQTFAAKQKAAFTLVHDVSHKAAGFFNPPTMPSSYLVDRKGTIRHIHKGFKRATTEPEYVKEIEALLAE